jgi:hypothetical protein
MIEYLVYTEAYNGNLVWDGTSYRVCNEGIPPKGDVQPVTPTETPEPTVTPAATNSPTISPTRNRTRTAASSVSDSDDDWGPPLMSPQRVSSTLSVHSHTPAYGTGNET